MATSTEVESCLLGAGGGKGNDFVRYSLTYICHTALCLVNDDILCCLMLCPQSNGEKKLKLRRTLYNVGRVTERLNSLTHCRGIITWEGYSENSLTGF